ncbi:MAG: hypothetical protein JWO83_2970 [Caulobacteraceae bacterium]|nr:hypothetical protein [Caulobacteraceae bacterium]
MTGRALAEEAAPTDAAVEETSSTYAADDFAKLSRAVRLTLDLAGRLEESLRALRAGEIAVRAVRRQEGEARAARAGMVRAAAACDKVAEQVAMVISTESESERDSSDLL